MRFAIVINILMYLLHFSRGFNQKSSTNDRYLVKNNRYSYTVSLQTNNGHVCTGEIIGDDHILTAAHCVINVKDNSFLQKQLTAIIGVADFKDERAKPKKIDIETIYVPKSFKVLKYKGSKKDNRFINDIAVLKLKMSINLRKNKELKKLELPKNSNINYEGIEASISGFKYNWVREIIDSKTGGLVEVGDTDGKMFYATTVVISNKECSTLQSAAIYEDDVCAIVKHHDDDDSEGACYVIRSHIQGESGGPLVHDDGTELYVIGVLSHSPNICDGRAKPRVYTRVISYKNFIEDAKNHKHKADMRVATWIINEYAKPNAQKAYLYEHEYSHRSSFNSCNT